MIAWADAWGHTHVASAPPPPAPPLAEQLEMLYPRRHHESLPECWPAPAELNEPLDRPIATSSMSEREGHAQLLRRTAAVPESPPICPLPDVPAPAAVVVPPAGKPVGVAGYGPTHWRYRTCEVDGCTAKVYGRGNWRKCAAHHWRSLPPLPIPLPRMCDFDGCHELHLAKGLCCRHYHQQRRGEQLKPLTPHQPVEQRFWSKVDRSSGGDSCWLWTGATNRGGYAPFTVDGHSEYAHYFAYEQLVGPVAEGFRLTRRPGCPKRCVNPQHWRLATYTEINRAIVKTRRKRCHSPIEPEQAASVPTAPAIPATPCWPQHWRQRWRPKHKTS
jgi:hypothetical protein